MDLKHFQDWLEFWKMFESGESLVEKLRNSCDIEIFTDFTLRLVQ